VAVKPPNRVAFAVLSSPDTWLNASEGSLAVIFVLMSSDGL
jgi:hypothetical protein